MYWFPVLFGLVAVVSAADKEAFKIPQKNLENFQKASQVCAEENNVDSGLIAKIADGTLPRDDASNNYLYCATLKAGFIKENGDIVIEKLVDVMKGHPLAEQFKVAVTKCNEITKENLVATLTERHTCVIGTSPVRFVI